MFSGKTYLVLRKLKRISQTDFFMRTSSPVQYYEKTKTEVENRHIREYDGGIVVFDDIVEVLSRKPSGKLLNITDEAKKIII